MHRVPDRRLRFSVEQDMQLLREVIKRNPFEDMDRWRVIHENFVNECNVPFSLRTCKDHANHLLNLHLKDALKMRPRELPEDFAEKRRYLDQILEMTRQFCAETTPRRKSKSSGGWEESYNETVTTKNEPTGVKSEDSDDDDFYWEEENERDKREKEREANDVDGKLRKQEVALEERKLALRERRLKLEEERLELDKLERNRRLDMEKAEREMYRKVAMQNQMIITTLMDRYNRRTNGNNLCIL